MNKALEMYQMREKELTKENKLLKASVGPLQDEKECLINRIERMKMEINDRDVALHRYKLQVKNNGFFVTLRKWFGL